MLLLCFLCTNINWSLNQLMCGKIQTLSHCVLQIKETDIIDFLSLVCSYSILNTRNSIPTYIELNHSFSHITNKEIEIYSKAFVGFLNMEICPAQYLIRKNSQLRVCVQENLRWIISWDQHSCPESSISIYIKNNIAVE